MIKVSIIGGSGYAGGELLRLLLGHPQITVKQVTSERFAGQPIGIVHPNLRAFNQIKFCPLKSLAKSDFLFVALPNGQSMSMMTNLQKLAPKIIDLGADFRLKSEEIWFKWYKTKHKNSQLLNSFVYGLPELHRNKIRKARLVAGPGCEAIVSILSLWPLVKHNLISSKNIIIDAKMASSQAGNKPSSASHHPERAGAVRSYLPTGHRHTAEIEQELTINKRKAGVSISATAIEMVRGVLVTIHTLLEDKANQKDIWKAYRQEYEKEPFIRLVKQTRGLYRYPEPKILQGSNFCDIGFEYDSRSNRLVAIGAIDNLVKGTAGNAVQCFNLMMGFPETMGLEFPGLHPI